MHYQSVFAKLERNKLISLLLKGIPEKDLGYGAEISAMSSNTILHKVVPSGYMSENDLKRQVRTILFQHITDTKGKASSIAETKKSVAYNLNKLRSSVIERLLNEQQKEMSLEFFEQLDVNSSNTPPKPKELKKFNVACVNESLDDISESFICYEKIDHVSIAVSSNKVNTITYSNENYRAEDLYTASDDINISLLLFEGALLYNLTETDMNEDAPKYAELLHQWCLNAINTLIIHSEHKYSREKNESLGAEVSALSMTLALAAIIVYNMKRQSYQDTQETESLINAYLKSNHAFPNYPEATIKNIVEWMQ